MKQHSANSSSTDPSNPLAALLIAVAGVHTSEKPRQKSAVNCWAKSQTAANAIKQLVRQACIANSVEQKNSMAVWNRIAKEQFSKLPQDKQRYWEQRAKDDHVKVIEQWKAAREADISTKPEDGQRCISGIVRLGQEFLDRLAEATGWKWSLIGGGPEPASEGQLTVISLHGGTNDEGNLNFGQKECELYRSHILPVFAKFLKECYTPEECRSQAFTNTYTVPLADAGLEKLGINFDVVYPPEDSTVAATVPPPGLRACSHVPVGNMGTSALPSTVAVIDSTLMDSQIERDRERASPMPAPGERSPPASIVSTQLGSPRHRPAIGIDEPPVPDVILPPSELKDDDSASVTTSASATGHIGTNFVPTTHIKSHKRRASPPCSAPPEKRARASSLEPLVAHPSPLSDRPWFKKALDMLQTDSLGAGWTNLVRTWIKFEEMNHDCAQTPLSTNQRPTGGSERFDRERPPHDRSVTDDSKEKYVSWWSSLRTHWRVHDDGNPCAVDADAGKFIYVDNGALEEPRKPGENDLLSILASLYFWGVEVKENAEESGKWVQAVDDCTFVLRILSSAP